MCVHVCVVVECHFLLRVFLSPSKCKKFTEACESRVCFLLAVIIELFALLCLLLVCVLCDTYVFHTLGCCNDATK